MNSQKLPSYSLSSCYFENFKGIIKTGIKNLPPTASWIFLTGENGYGKTSVLQALATTLIGVEEHLFQYFSEHENISLYASLHGSKLNFNTESASFIKNHKEKFSYLACYGSSRLDTYSESSKVKNNITENLFNNSTLLQNIEYQLTRWYAKREVFEFKQKYETTRKLLIDILQIKNIIIDYKTDKVFYIEKDFQGNGYEKLTLNELASGYRSLIAMVGDMILRLFQTQPKVTDPSELQGIIIIDELDLHFHPKWQKRLPLILTKHFPRIQFVASTHSPIPFLGAPKDSVFLTVNRTVEEGITIERARHLENQIATLTPNLLLNSYIFGHADVYSNQFHPNQNIQTEDTFDEIRLNETLKKTFLDELGSNKKEQLRALLRKNR